MGQCDRECVSPALRRRDRTRFYFERLGIAILLRGGHVRALPARRACANRGLPVTDIRISASSERHRPICVPVRRREGQRRPRLHGDVGIAADPLDCYVNVIRWPPLELDLERRSAVFCNGHRAAVRDDLLVRVLFRDRDVCACPVGSTATHRGTTIDRVIVLPDGQGRGLVGVPVGGRKGQA